MSLRLRAGLIVGLALVMALAFRIGYARAEGEGSDEGSAEHHEGSAQAEEHHEGSAQEHHDDGSAVQHPDEHHEGSAAEHHDAAPEHPAHHDTGDELDEHHHVDHAAHDPGISADDAKIDADGDGIADIDEVTEDPDADPEDDPDIKLYDADGDGMVEPEEMAENKEFDADMKEVGITSDEPDNKALAEREDPAKHATAMMPSMTIAQFQKLVGIARKVVLGKMAVKIERKNAKRMKTFSLIVVGVSGLGIFLLLMPLFLAKKYPGQGKLLLKYSALAALTFIVTVNLFGGVLFGLRTVQGALSGLTNPQVAIASGTFDTLHDDAEEYIVTGKELFGPTLKAMREHPEKQPVEILLENGLRLVGDVKVILSIKNMIKKLDWAFGFIPIILTLVTLVLFVLAIRPTLMEIVRMPARAAQGHAAVGKDVMKKSMGRVIGELKATVCTIAVLTVLTIISSVVLGNMLKPALKAFLEYFAKAVNYLLFSNEPSTGLVFVALFAVVLFLVLNLATLILSMAFFLGKCQKIFQQRFNEGTPISTHQHFFKWGVPSVLLVQVFPLVFALVVSKILDSVNNTAGIANPDEVSWTRIMLMGPLILVVSFLATFWAARGFKAIKFLFKYKVKLKTTPGAIGEAPQDSPR